MARITPIFKSGTKDNIPNYRPIYVLSTIAKVFEIIIYNRLYNNLQTHNLLSKYQSGFRPRHSTTTALLDATIEWFTNMDNGQINSVVFLWYITFIVWIIRFNNKMVSILFNKSYTCSAVL